ncbi:MAG: 1-(5-phosphoribosyl)-5-[(5-phosphoribosylamino)methylideneamino]imidazole-4-carboxamide isomerase [Gammaproteobacteria bacterium]|nr:1-(5-phosphoribosyl)-5-[(5-phosphoribosylamino)methylideneamino]imidazole-4-carboxamide isomerase [Gammaproteobacteria bacterium]MBQ08278.1 1-(5-phosphoribosyl)-5-[(5-phosphoribosylamino)methylideneamino]imidazole-4-carboxamide isomerase [Gammaproteobacteria bacterium]MDP6147302.1 1-(5-phosphoribosyl)-5-[(5-phosphoribosylamino)methylideneamino]imidazole-4-carboxamide isomerase [Gammaproteobacteria bacterium]HJL80785.1 1-(5-phosphoribosyl)-5-[(5-phosphoribosylamino)methylideneamino]imidazole-4|tara:strand:- start:8323 stop:9066 length:744 start_codon:yes stop_codon:yes gene_type:complete
MSMNLIPAIDLLDQKCVRLLRGDFDQVTFYQKEPLQLAKHYESLGCEYLHIVDLNGTRDGYSENEKIVDSIITQTNLKVQMGGGIRSMLSIKYWLNSGLSKLVIGSYAIEEYNQFVTSFDSEVRSRIIVALDIMILDGLPTIRIHGWQKDSKMNLLSTIKSFVDNGFKDFLITDISKDGTLEGPNIDLYRQINEKFKEINVIASGGVSKFSDLIKLDDISMQSVVVGKSLLENKITDQEVIQFLQKE